MNKIVRYDIFNKETEEIIESNARDLYIKLLDNPDEETINAIKTMPMEVLINELYDKGYIVSPVHNVEVLQHGTEEIDTAQISVNTAEDTNIIDVSSKTVDGQLLTVIRFYGDGDKVVKRYYTKDGEECNITKSSINEEEVKQNTYTTPEPGDGEVVEWCSVCEEEVIIKDTKLIQQTCPNCGEPIRACCMCDDCNYECLDKEEEENDK